MLIDDGRSLNKLDSHTNEKDRQVGLTNTMMDLANGPTDRMTDRCTMQRDDRQQVKHKHTNKRGLNEKDSGKRERERETGGNRQRIREQDRWRGRGLDMMNYVEK